MWNKLCKKQHQGQENEKKQLITIRNSIKIMRTKLISLIKNNCFLNTPKSWNVSDWSLEIPVPDREMKHARQPIRSGGMLNSSDNGH